MRLLITHEIRAYDVDGKHYNPKGLIDYDALCNYRYLIKDVLVVLRYVKADKKGDGWLRVDGTGITVAPIPKPDNAVQILFMLPRMVRQIRNHIKSCDRYVVRLPGPTGMMVAIVLMLMRKGYGVEFVGHPGMGYIQAREYQKLKDVYAYLLHITNRILVRHAKCVAYRSQYLRKLYPNKHAEHEWVFSGAQLGKDVITSPRTNFFFDASPFKIISVGRLGGEKGHMSLIEAFRKVRDGAQKAVQLHIVGDGTEFSKLKERIQELDMSDVIIMHGRVPRGPGLFSLLDDAQLFVLPSLTEGMPRSLIEAMARGMPAFGSAAGGIPELLNEESLFPPADVEKMAEKILSVIDRPEKLQEMSKINFENSKQHWPEVLARAKDGFWNDVLNYCK